MAQAARGERLRGVERNRAVDLVRSIALLAVVTGHWLKQGWYVDGGELHRAGLLGTAPWTHPLTWVFQVMPLFFVVGGYVNAPSWRHARARGVAYGAWLSGRVRRLTRPLLPLLGFWAVAVPVAPLLGLGDDWVRIGSKASLLPTWFLAVYLPVVALVPLTLAAWERWGLWTVAVGAAALLVDAASLTTGSDLAGALNVLLVWGVLHQAGYAWQDDALAPRSTSTALAAGGLVTAVALVWAGPYGVSMVGVDGHGVNNTNPPRATLLCLGLAMAGAVVLAEPLLARLAERPLVWVAVVALNRRMMTIYLWHLTALTVLGAVVLQAGGTGLHALPASGVWWAWRTAWIAALALLTAAFVRVVGRFEDPPADAPAHRAVRPLAEVVVASSLLGVLADDGLRALAVDPTPWLVLLLGLGTLVVLERGGRRT